MSSSFHHFSKYCKKNYLKGVANILNRIKDSAKKHSYITKKCPKSGYNSLFLAVKFNRFRLLKLLMQHLNHQEQLKIGENLFFSALKFGRVTIIEHLLSQDTEIVRKFLTNRKNSFTPLMIASRDNSPEIVNLILSKAGDFKYDLMSQFNFNGSPPLISAAKRGHLKVVRTLLEHCKLKKNSIYQTDAKGMSALMQAVKKGEFQIVEEILKNSGYLKEHLIQQLNHSECNSLMIAANLGHVKCATILLKHCKDKEKLIFQSTIFGSNALHFAAEEGHHEIVKLLIENCPNGLLQKLIKSTDQDKNTALILAAETNHLRSIKALLENANNKRDLAEHVDKNGKKALLHAVKNNNQQAVEALYEHSNSSCSISTLLRHCKTPSNNDIVRGC